MSEDKQAKAEAKQAKAEAKARAKAAKKTAKYGSRSLPPGVRIVVREREGESELVLSGLSPDQLERLLPQLNREIDITAEDSSLRAGLKRFVREGIFQTVIKVIAGLIVGFLLLKFGLGCTQAVPPTPPNVILITFDTLRADHLGCYGYRLDTSPHLDAFAAGASLYTRAMASSPWTVPTHASLFTGKYPFEHGARAYKVPPGSKNNVGVLAEGHVTLAEVLVGEGYATGAFMGNVAYLSPDWQLNQGFLALYLDRKWAKDLNEKALEWLTRIQGQPFFLFLNYIDTHRPYNTSPRPGLLPEPAVQDGGELLDQLYEAVMPGTAPAPPELAQKVIDQYDTSIANVDEAFGALMARLKEMGLYENTMIIATSDHGEFFGEHGLVEHSKDIYQEVIWVPMIVKNPRQAGGRIVDTPTSSVDIPGLVFSQFPEETARKHLETFPSVPGNHPVITQIYYTRMKDLDHPVWGHRFQRARTGVYEWPYKFISSTDEKHELYRLDVDPQEQDNLLPEQVEVARRLFDSLEAYRSSRSQGGEAQDVRPLSPEQLERLRSLGYTGN